MAPAGCRHRPFIARRVSRGVVAVHPKGVGVSVPTNATTISRPAGQRLVPDTGSAAKPTTALAVDLGSGSVGVWAAHRGFLSGPCGDAFASVGRLVRRGQIVDAAGCATLLSDLLRQYTDPVPAGGIVVACRPVLSTQADEQAMRRVLTDAFAPSRLLFIDTVRAAAIGAGAAAGTLLIADVGAQLTEVAVLRHGHVIAARRTNIGTRDTNREASPDLLPEIVRRHVNDLRADPAAPGLASAAAARGLILVGDGALHPGLSVRLSAALRLRVHCAAAPRTAALNGAALAAMTALRHPSIA
ncbi:rod shape-determining protein [Micromonospora sp. NPDC047548]|uniref:rod shape-determining protein n=1 Tax=Micromonospora sp. NPDC047548 TaxID=3155624 RepID=UPI0033C31A25